LVANRQNWLAVSFGVVFLAAHLPYLARTPVTVDSVNFSLGVREFDVADHRPHPPGYPVFIGLGKVALPFVEAIWSAGDPSRNAIRALAIWSTVFGAIGIVILFYFLRLLDDDGQRGAAATALTVTCPLFWFNAVRPMSDIAGLVIGVAAQALLIGAFRQPSGHRCARFLALGALASALAIGFRSQNAWLTMPLLIWVLVARHVSAGCAARVAAAFGVGVLAWAGPVIVATGGPTQYLAAITRQATEDLARADLLTTHPTGDRLIAALLQTFAYPWAHAAIAAVMLVAGVFGAATLIRRDRSTAGLIAVATVPYALFHLMFQESLHIRYALPLVPAMAYLAVHGLHSLGRRTMPWIVAAICVAGIAITFQPVAAYARTDSLAFQAVSDIRRQASVSVRPPVIAMHHAIARVLRGESLPAESLPVTPKHEWLALVNHWRTSPDVPVWFLAEARRLDLALVDRTSQRLMRSYAWAFPRKFVMGRVPATGLDWYELQPPGWIAGEGWSLSPEAAGVAFEDDRLPGARPIVAFVRARSGPATVMIGGQNRSGPGGPVAHLELSIGGKPIESWRVGTDPGSFLRMSTLPAGTLAGSQAYVPLEIRATPLAHGGKPLNVAIDQFDLQPADAVVFGYDMGWYEEEFDGAAPRPWRWSRRSGTLRVHHAGRNVRVRLIGEAPLKYLKASPSISVRAGNRVLARFVAQREEVDVEIPVPADALDASGGLLTIDTDPTFIPDDVIGNGDHRRLGVRMYQIEVKGD
jgi:hypothetical protein